MKKKIKHPHGVDHWTDGQPYDRYGQLLCKEHLDAEQKHRRIPYTKDNDNCETVCSVCDKHLSYSVLL